MPATGVQTNCRLKGTAASGVIQVATKRHSFFRSVKHFHQVDMASEPEFFRLRNDLQVRKSTSQKSYTGYPRDISTIVRPPSESGNSYRLTTFISIWRFFASGIASAISCSASGPL